MNPVKKRIIRFLKGEESFPMEAIEFYTGKTKELVALGVQGDADILLYAHKIKNKIYVAGMIGNSLVYGEDLSTYLKSYFLNSGGFDDHDKKIANYFYQDLNIGLDSCMMLRDEFEGWRSFNPLKTIEEMNKRMGN